MSRQRRAAGSFLAFLRQQLGDARVDQLIAEFDRGASARDEAALRKRLGPAGYRARNREKAAKRRARLKAAAAGG